MRRIALVVGMVVCTGGIAHAQSEKSWVDRNPSLVGIGAFTAVAADMTFTAEAFAHERPGPKLAVLEIALTAPQAGILIWEAAANPSQLDDTSRALLLVASAWPAALTLHGGWSLLRGAREEPATMALAPLVAPDGARLAFGLGASGRF
jgi:hypothetical protein